MNIYEDINNKKLQIQTLSETILNNAKDRDIYFVTFTFKDSFYKASKEDLKDYFTAFFQNINTNSMNARPQNSHKKCILIAFPEKSYKDPLQSKIALDHYHAFLLVHKDNKDRFFKRAVEKISTVVDEHLNKFVKVLHLKESLINCLRLRDNNSHKSSLKLQTHSLDIRAITDLNDVPRVSNYITKRFKYDFSIDDVQIFCNVARMSRT